MHLVNSDKKEGTVVETFGGLANSLSHIFSSDTERTTRWTGLSILTYYMNPFNLIPPANSDTSFFDELGTVSNNLKDAFRGGLFRRGDED